jgi:AcrR family transcriptional regulator
MTKKKEKVIQAGILASAKRLFAQFGPKKTTMEEIAQEAGVGKGTIYYYFTDKADIFLQVIKNEAEQLANRMKSAAVGQENPEQKLNAVFFEKLQALSELVNLRWLYNYIEIGRWSGVEKETAELAEKEQKLVEQILEEGKDKGLFAIEDVAKIAQTLLKFFAAFGKTLPQGLAPNELKKSIEDTLSFIFEGLGRAGG